METMQTDLKFKDKQPAFDKMQKLSELSSMTKAESDQYFWEQDYYRTIKNAEGYEYELGEKKGREQGFKQGELSVAKKMKLKGMELALISEVTGLSTEEISKL